MKRNLIIIAKLNNKDDGEFYQMALDQGSFLHEKAVVLLFSNATQFDEFLHTMSGNYQFALLIHMGKWPHKVAVAGDSITQELSKLPYFTQLEYEYTSRDGESTHNDRMVWHTPKLTAKVFKVENLPLNEVSKLLPGQENSVSEKVKPKIDFAVLTALDEHENETFRSFMKKDTCKELDLTTYQGHFESVNGVTKDYQQDFILASQRNMGMVDAAFASGKLIHHFEPDYLIMAGVCGGRQTKVKMFDIIIPEKVYDFSFGSLEEGIFLQRDLDAKIDSDLIAYLKRTAIRNDIKTRMLQLVDTREDHWRKYVQDVEIHFDVMACGPWVVKTEAFLEDLSKEKNNSIRGLEMESYSIGRAFELYRDISKTLIVKSVMDYTDTKKGDEFNGVPVKKIAAYISCLCVRALMPVLIQFKNRKLEA